MTPNDTPAQQAAPGDTMTPYDFPLRDQWAAVIYYPVGEVEPGEGKLWLVEPFPAARADASDGLDFDYMGTPTVAVLRGDAAPRPRGASRDGDWIVPGVALANNCAYEATAVDQADLLAKWIEAYAIAAALNAGVENITPEDIEVLLAAEHLRLKGDSRFAGTSNELRWKRADDAVATNRVLGRQARRLRDQLRLIDVRKRERVEPRKPGFSSSGTAWTQSTYGLTLAGYLLLAEIRQYAQANLTCAPAARTVRYVVDSKTHSTDWVPYVADTVETATQDPNAIARAVAASLGVPPGSGARIAWDALVRVRVWPDVDELGQPSVGEYVYDALARVREANAALD